MRSPYGHQIKDITDPISVKKIIFIINAFMEYSSNPPPPSSSLLSFFFKLIS